MKKLLILILTVITVFSLVACGEEKPAENNSKPSSSASSEQKADSTEGAATNVPAPEPTEAAVPTEAPTPVPATAEPTYIEVISEKSKIASVNEINDLKLGSVITTDFMSFSVDSVELTDKLHCFTNSTGQSSYLEEAGIKFLALHGVITNIGTQEYYSFPYVFFCKVNDTVYNYRVDPIQSFWKGSNTGKMEPGDTYEYVIYARVPVALADAMETYSFTIGINNSQPRISESTDSEGVITFNADRWYKISG